MEAHVISIEDNKVVLYTGKKVGKFYSKEGKRIYALATNIEIGEKVELDESHIQKVTSEAGHEYLVYNPE